MRLRPYLEDLDFPVVSRWITDERTHALWSAKLLPYPLERESFHAALREHAAKDLASPFVALGEDGTPAGFFCFGISGENDRGQLTFVVVDSERRGRGLGTQMLRLAVRYASEIAGAACVELDLFDENTPAKRCYERVGFVQDLLEKNVFPFAEERWSHGHMVWQKPE